MTEQVIFLKSFQSPIGMRWEKSLPYNIQDLIPEAARFLDSS